MSLQRCQEETSSTQFLDWIEYLKWDVNAFHREDYYLAQIACEVRRILAKDPNKEMDLKRFLFKFVKKERPKRLTKKEATKRSKRRWLSWAGIKLRKEK